MSPEDQKNRVFLKIVRGIIGQGCIPSVDAIGRCAYRGLNGLKCAAGHCISNKEYKVSYENHGISIYNGENDVTKFFINKYQEVVIKLIIDCQRNHDSIYGLRSEKNPQLLWAKLMIGTAKKHEVNSPTALAMLETVITLNS